MDKRMYIALVMAFLAAMAMGISDGALGVAWPAIRLELGLPLEWATVLIITSSVFYTVVSSQSGPMLRRTAPENITALGILSIAIGFGGYVLAPNFIMLAVFTAFVGTGTGLIDTSVNYYMAKSFSARHMNWMHSFWGLGASISPIVMTQMILLFNWRAGYGGLAAFQLAALVVIFISIARKVWKVSGGEIADEDSAAGFLTKRRHIFAQLFSFFLQSGIEGSIFFWITSIMQDSRGLSVAASGVYATVYFAAIVAGRVAFGYLAKYLSNAQIIRIGLGLAIVSMGIMAFVSSPIAMFAAGFGLAPVFPCLMHETKGRFAPNALTKLVGYQIAAAGAGVAVISPAIGLLLSNISLEALFPAVIVLMALVTAANEWLSRQARANP